MEEYLEDTVEFDPKGIMIPKLEKDIDPIQFLELEEAARDSRHNRLDAGDEMAKLKFKAGSDRPAQQQGGNQKGNQQQHQKQRGGKGNNRGQFNQQVIKPQQKPQQQFNKPQFANAQVVRIPQQQTRPVNVTQTMVARKPIPQQPVLAPRAGGNPHQNRNNKRPMPQGQWNHPSKRMR